MLSQVTNGSATMREILWEIPLALGRQLIGAWYRFCIDRSGEIGIDIRLRHPVSAVKNFDPLGGWE